MEKNHASAGQQGAPDALGVPLWDFSTNANACSPEPTAWQAVWQTDPARYPDPTYASLRAALARSHAVAADRIVRAASASEFISRMSLAVAQRVSHAGAHSPWPGYADYMRAGEANGLARAATPLDAHLLWHTEPGSPQGESASPPAHRAPRGRGGGDRPRLRTLAPRRCRTRPAGQRVAVARLPGSVRLSVQPPAAQRALLDAWHRVTTKAGT